MDASHHSKGDILIVDDTLDNLRLLSAMLTEQGYDVRGVTNGSTALMGIRAQPPDLILLDINMPGMNGYQTCEQLKADPTTHDIPIIFISALNEVFDKVRAFSVGGVDYISKPFQLEEVFARIEHQLAIQRLQAQLQTQNQQLQATETELMRSLEQERSLNQRIEEMAALEERNRIARDIHDSLGHALVALNIQMETAIALWQEDPNRAYEFLAEAKQLGSEALDAVRQSVSGMRGNPLQGKLLEGAIATLADEFYNSTGIRPQCTLHLCTSLSNQVNTTLFRVVQEGLTNTCKHAQASAVEIQIVCGTNEIVLTLHDNGQGFDGAENSSGFGLQGMRERIEAVGGELRIESSPGQGCTITATVPL